MQPQQQCTSCKKGNLSLKVSRDDLKLFTCSKCDNTIVIEKVKGNWAMKVGGVLAAGASLVAVLKFFHVDSIDDIADFIDSI